MCLAVAFFAMQSRSRSNCLKKAATPITCFVSAHSASKRAYSFNKYAGLFIKHVEIGCLGCFEFEACLAFARTSDVCIIPSLIFTDLTLRLEQACIFYEYSCYWNAEGEIARSSRL